MLRALAKLGFGHVVATPHIRPQMFENNAEALRWSFLAFSKERTADLPEISLASEHFFDDTVIHRIHAGEGLPYAPPDCAEAPQAARGILIEFHDLLHPATIEREFFALQRRGFLPIVAHPERYRAAWEAPERLQRLRELGAGALLDLGSLVGKYGREAERCSRRFLDLELYDAACSDSHRESDVGVAEKAMGYITREYGQEELDFLLGTGAHSLFRGRRPPG